MLLKCVVLNVLLKSFDHSLIILLIKLINRILFEDWKDMLKVDLT